MKIGVDIDGVLTNDDDYILDYTAKYCYDNNIPFYNDPYKYETRKLDFDDKTLDDYRKKYFWNYVQNEPARRFASEVLTKLQNEGNEIYIITSRYLTYEQTKEGEQMRMLTKQWLKNNKIPYNNIYFVPDKTIVIDELKLDLIIEDSPKTIPIFVNHTHVFCYDCRYNRDLNLNNMTRVYSWYDILKNIEEFKK